LREISGFTLIELMAATTVLSVVLLMMVGMQDQMSKAWANANRRTESTREARAGLRMLTEDFTHYYVRSDLSTGYWSRANYNPITDKIPIVYFTDASTTVGKLTISNAQPKSQALFFLSQRRPGTNRDSDRLTAVGYYIASETNMSISGFTTTSYNLYRYVNTNTVSALINFTDANDVRSLFPNVGTTFKSNNEILARNAVNLRIYFYPASSVTGGLIYGIRESDTNTTYTGNRCVFEVTTYPDSIANSLLQGNLTNWTSPNNIKRYGRTFEVTMDLERWLPDQR
jgi:prepilin-type N-terminal cleavage/methylation domain-containing protein